MIKYAKPNRKKTYWIIAGEAILFLALIIAGGVIGGRDTPEYSSEPSTEAPLVSWQEMEGNLYYFLPETGEMAKFWQVIDGARYYFGDDGILATQWLEIDDGIYYLGENGKMVTGPITVDGKLVFFGKDGRLETGWQTINQETYYFSREGALTGWQELDGSRYFFSDAGVRVTGWHVDGEHTYFLDADGKMKTGWLDLEQKRYYLDESGVLVTGWQTMGSDQYYFREDGRMAIGKLEIDGVNRFFTSTGRYVIMPNPWNPVPEDFTMNLVDIEGYKFDASGRDALADMLRACRNAGLSCGINNTYRSKGTQQYLWDNGIKKRMDKGMTYEEALADTKRAVMIPGHSEHQTGLAVDIDGNDAADAWLGEHCWDYGFILRYPDDREEITGIKYEPWHFRYVGMELSKELEALGMCMEEYMDMLTQQQAKIS